jgi:hypothetical protein
MLIRVYEHKKTGETFLIPDPKLGFDQLSQVQTEVAEMLGIPPKPDIRSQIADVSQQKEQTAENTADAGVAKDEQVAVQPTEETEEAEMRDENEDEDELDDEDEDEFEDDEDGDEEDDEESEKD